MGSLTGAQYEQFSKVLRAAFTPQQLRRLLQFKLDKNLDNISLAGDYEQLVFDLIGQAEREAWTDRLLLAARQSNPSNPTLLAFAQQFGLAPANLPGRPELERLIVATNSLLDINGWRQRLGQIEVQVCRVELKGQPAGTGFLLGPSVVMTNYHVVEPVIQGGFGYTPADIVLRFDYKRLSDGKTLNEGTVYGVAKAGWLIDSSPYSDVDSQPPPKSATPAEDELDYALLRVDGAPGDEAVGGGGDPQAPRRRWIDLPQGDHDFRANPALYIVQHPKGEPLKLALDNQAILDVNANGTRVTYRTNTEPGSSGSPCFDQNWNLVALHHSGDPDQFAPTWNEGIPFGKILALLKQRGHDALLGEQQL